ncbi:hypothetical protein CSKR_105968 [Clonorchis sinensis]|uniref:Uncharacterized protein n=1 Tax=Clonorchis sinensis TaxID=79923 RepID=A0A419PZ78_CLOSI|nr:hypothetical protein CSKR_105968 [Clonorchis sinensis]
MVGTKNRIKLLIINEEVFLDYNQRIRAIIIAIDYQTNPYITGEEDGKIHGGHLIITDTMESKQTKQIDGSIGKMGNMPKNLQNYNLRKTVFYAIVGHTYTHTRQQAGKKRI